MIKRILPVALSSVMLLSLLAGCGAASTKQSDSSSANSTAASTNAQATTVAAPAPVTITVGEWPRENDADKRKTYDGYVAALKQKYPDITIKPDDWQYSVDTFLPKAASGQLPTVYGTFFTEPNKIINGGYAADVTDVVKKIGLDQAINPDFLKIGMKDNKIYGVPSDGYAMGMWYNLKLLKQAGLYDGTAAPKWPQTYDELAQWAKTIKDKTGKSGFCLTTKNNQGGWEFMNIAWSFGAEFEKQVNGKWTAAFNSPEAVAALQYVKDLKWKYDVLPANMLVDNTEMTKLLATDQVGMAYGMHYWKNDPTNTYKMSKDDIAMSALPGGPSARYACAGGQMFMFSANSTPEQLDAAFKWLEITGYSAKVDPEVMKGFEDQQANDAKANLPVGPHGVRVWVNPERVQAEDAIYKKYTNVNMDLWNDFVNNAGKYMHPEEPQDAQDLYKTLDPVVQAVLLKKDADPKALLDKAAADFQKTYLDKIK